MYGGLDLAESIRLGTLGALKDSDHAPHIARRGIKFNVPLDVRTPSYSDSGDAAQQNTPEMWSFDFWRDFIDDMARHRYNVLSLWNLHPFPSLVKVPEYLDIALDDVKRTRVKIDDTFAPTGAHPRTIITNLSRPMAERPGMSRGPRVSTRRSRCPRSAGSAMAAFYSSGTNTTPLPETEKDDPALPSGMLEGYREDVFTNRDTIHAAISSDEGHTWRGFRELYLDPRRAARDYGDR